MKRAELTVGFIGNPNCGKTTLFNAYTGANLKVANWPGVTVEKVEGMIQSHEMTIHLIDLPGTYSLTSYTMEEQVARNFILSDEVDVIIDVVDASSLERNLYLTLQLLELGKPVILALNMMDIVEKRGMEIDLHRLPELLGVPVIPISARNRKGLQTLLHAAIHHKDGEQQGPFIHDHDDKTAHCHDHHSEYAMVYRDELEDKIDYVITQLRNHYGTLPNERWYAIKTLEQDREIREKYPLELPPSWQESYETDIINEKYDFIEEVVKEAVFHKSEKEEATDRVDAILTHSLWGVPAFLCIMAIVFFLTFMVGDVLTDYFEEGIGIFSDAVRTFLAWLDVAPLLQSLIVDGIIAGVGSILTFLPNIFILFLSLAFLEDSGYMARVAYVMDSIMGRLGLSGRAFIPMILGFGCTVPAIMASRALENMKDRYRTMLVTPFMSCSARLPVYILFSAMFFGAYAPIAAYSMYLLGILAALCTLFILHQKDKKEEEDMLLIELPEYKRPSTRTVCIYVWEKIKEYLTRAGTTIFLASIAMWVILNFGPQGYSGDMSDSFGAWIGKFLVPFFAPLGLGLWQIGVALLAGISAKEVVVSSCAVLFGIGNINSSGGMEALRSSLAQMGFGPLEAYCLMVFCLLYVPCAATLATVRKESGSWRWTAMMAGFQIGVAWIVTFFIYQIGSLW